MRIWLDKKLMASLGTDTERVEKALTAHKVVTKRERNDDESQVLIVESNADPQALMDTQVQELGTSGKPVFLRDISRIELRPK